MVIGADHGKRATGFICYLLAWLGHFVGAGAARFDGATVSAARLIHDLDPLDLGRVVQGLRAGHGGRAAVAML